MKTENLKDEITSSWKDIEPTFDQNLRETITQQEKDNKKLNENMKLL